MEYIEAKHIVTKGKSAAWFGADYNMNIYRGCSHGCIYCDSRSECYRIEEFDTVKPKRDALKIIRDDLRRKVKTGVVATGAMSDPYNPLEKEQRLTRNALELINAYGFGVAIATKSTLITRDIDILCDINEHSPVIAKITVTDASDDAARIIEPRAPLSSERFEAIAKLSENGIFAGVLLMPVLPFIQDNEENIVRLVGLAHEAGARFVYAAFGVTLRDRQREYFYKKLDESFPEMKQRYIEAYKYKYNCTSPEVKRLRGVFVRECEKYGIIYGMRAIISAYKYPRKGEQLTLL